MQGVESNLGIDSSDKGTGSEHVSWRRSFLHHVAYTPSIASIIQGVDIALFQLGMEDIEMHDKLQEKIGGSILLPPI